MMGKRGHEGEEELRERVLEEQLKLKRIRSSSSAEDDRVRLGTPRPSNTITVQTLLRV
jgi:hypothetical protein